MPRENKKRGRRAKRDDGFARAPVEPEPPLKKPKLRLPTPVDAEVVESTAEATSRWPVLDPDTRAYFKSIQDRIIELENLGLPARDEQEPDDDEDGESRATNPC